MNHWLILAALLQLVWPIVWVNEILIASILLKCLLLYSLFRAYRLMHSRQHSLRTIEKWMVHIPISIFISWMSITMLAHLAVVLTANAWSISFISVEQLISLLVILCTFFAVYMVTFQHFSYTIMQLEALFWGF